MKNIVSILKDLGVEVEESKQKDLEKALNENYKTIAEYESIKENNQKLKDDIKSRDEDIEELTKKLDDAGADKEKLAEVQDELKGFKTKYEEKTKEYEEGLEKQKYEFAVREHTGKLNFSSNAGKKTFMQDLMDSELKLDEDGHLMGFDDFVKDYKDKDAGVFAKESKAGKFGGKSNGGTSKMTKEDIMKIKDRAERQKAIAENLDLFETEE